MLYEVITHADLIVPPRFDFVIPIALSDFVGSLGEFLYWHDNAPRQIDSAPRRRQDEDQSDQE